MTDEEKNDILRSKILKKLEELGLAPSLLQENEMLFKVKGIPCCRMKYPHNDKFAAMLEHDNRQSKTN